MRHSRVATALVVAALALVGCGQTDAVRVPGDECAPGRSPAAGMTRHVIVDGGSQRTYLMHVPPGHDGSTKAPVVVLFHGLGGNPATMVASTRMAELADEEGFILVVPQAQGLIPRWDFTTAAERPESDLGFVHDLVADVTIEACVDPARIYAAGFSNGSALTLALACEDSRTFAAFGAVSAPVFDDSCRQAPARSLIYFHGTADRVVPFDGGRTAIGATPGVDQAMRGWAEHDACPPRGATTSVSEHIRRFAWTSCRGGAAVEVYEVVGGGHRWPGASSASPGRAEGTLTQEIDATALIWQFFVDHPRGGQ